MLLTLKHNTFDYFRSLKTFPIDSRQYSLQCMKHFNSEDSPYGVL